MIVTVHRNWACQRAGLHECLHRADPRAPAASSAPTLCYALDGRSVWAQIQLRALSIALCGCSTRCVDHSPHSTRPQNESTFRDSYSSNLTCVKIEVRTGEYTKKSWLYLEKITKPQGDREHRARS